MATFQDGLKAAAAYVRAQVDSTSSLQMLEPLAEAILALPEPGSGVVVLALRLVDIDAWFEAFKHFYPEGPRNHWTPAKKAFESAVLKRKFSPEVIIDGTIAFAESGKETKYIEAPAVFLNQDRFTTDYGVAKITRRPNLFEIEGALTGQR